MSNQGRNFFHCLGAGHPVWLYTPEPLVICFNDNTGRFSWEGSRVRPDFCLRDQQNIKPILESVVEVVHLHNGDGACLFLTPFDSNFTK